MASGSVVKFRPNIGYNSESLTVSNSVQVLTTSKFAPNSSTPGGADSAFVTNFGNSIRYWYDGSTPDANTGHVLPDGGVLVLQGQNQISQFKAIRVSADSIISVTYERE